jgi:hypothetical protein
VVRSKPYIFSKKMFQLARYCLRAFEMIIWNTQISTSESESLVLKPFKCWTGWLSKQ